MAIKDLLVAYDGNEASEKALEFALKMGVKYGASVTGIKVNTPPKFDSHVERWMPKGVLETMMEAQNEASAAIKEKFDALVKTSGYTGTVDWIVEQGQPDIMLARCARFYDLLLVGQFESAFGPNKHRTVDPKELLLRAATPVIIVPKDYQVRDFKETAAVAWDGSRFAARALTDAMQILETKKTIDLLVSDKNQTDDGDQVSRMPNLNIADHIRRHGLVATETQLDLGGRTAAKAILDHCAKTDPDVLIMGAYGRGSFTAVLFGSTTRDILENQNVPVLLSH
ncbi:MAG: universal stress protein [Alphaproteobacteria bacterium]|nr:universal stress protein [Alphaproteobacteria bacterium]